MQLSEEDRRTLLSRARQAVSQTVWRLRFPDLPAPTGRLAEPGAAFVTLRCNGKLRGCIGRTDATLQLEETVLQCAITAASQDPRFKPVCPEEVARLEIEISVLSDSRPIRPEEIAPGMHGIIVIRGGSRGLLLPQVATERNWTAMQFLDAACRKANLEADAWRDPETTLLAFTTEVFSDAEVCAQRERCRT